MLTTDQLRSLMADFESDRVEKTVSTKNTDKFGEAICAFANDFPGHRRPGFLLVGVDDNGQSSGLVVTDKLLRTLGELRSNVNLEPLPAMTVQKYTLNGDDAFAPLPTQSYPVAESMLRERTETDYPPVAIRELLLNAIMHRSYESNAPVRFYWYDDRIEIQNPGGLYGMASPENFPGQTDYRNPVIAEAMATLGYVNAFGRGVIRAQEALRKNGNPAAEFAFEPSHVLATIRRKP